jgi:dinuclear metal center YbgI/SA1388 family protein
MVGMKEKASSEVTVGDMVGLMESLAPSYLAEEWDNCGLQIGSRLWPAQRVWIALDPLPSVIHAAVRRKIDLIITHHPLLFHPLRSIDLQTPIGRTIETALAARLALYSAHTNLDSTRQGVNDTLAHMIGLHHLEALVSADKGAQEIFPGEPVGMGRLGRLAEPLTLKALAARIKTRLHLDAVKVAGDPDLMVDKVAVCSGSGSSLMGSFLDSSAQVYVSGDLRYHDARTVEEFGRALIDVGHFPSEHLVLDPLAEQLRNMARDNQWPVVIEACRLEHDPFVAF